MSNIENVLHENRRFVPPAEFAARAHVKSEEEYEQLYRRSIDDPEGFWGDVARELPWIEPFSRVLDWSDAPVARWFDDGKLNASAVCLDQHLATERRDKLAILWEGEPGDVERHYILGVE